MQAQIELGKIRASKASLENDDIKCHTIDGNETAHDEMGGLETYQPVALCFLRRDSQPRRWFIRLVSWPYFERITICVILINCVTLGSFDPSDVDCVTNKCHVLEKLETAIYVFFAVEMLVKWVAMGVFGKLGYFSDSWNRLDFFIVAAGTLELALGAGEELSSVRAIRVLRPLRAINRVPSIRILVTLLLDTLPMLGNVLAVCSFIFAIFGIVGVQMWGGLLRGRCFLQLPQNLSASSYNLTDYYMPSFEEDFVCSLSTNNGMKRCTADAINLYQTSNRSQCNESYESFQEKSHRSNYTNVCVNWNQYYNTCRLQGPNPYHGALSFDNIFIAWVAIFQIITLEGWSDIMYFIQDAYGIWNWIYFIVLIVVGSYFMTNLCLVVITTQFQETKQRESELMKANLRRQAASNSTLNSSRFGTEGCWTEILKYIEHLLRRLKRRVMRRFNCNYIGKSKTITRTSRRKKGRTKKHVYHHHHHHHHHHHFHHHVSCPIGNNLPIEPSEADIECRRDSNMYSTGNTLTVPGQVPPANHTHTRRTSHEGVPAINIVTGSSCSVRPDPHASASGEMMTMTKAEVSINGQSAVADVNTRSVLSPTALSSAVAASTASAAAASTIQNACACAIQHLENDMNVDYDTESVVCEENGVSDSEFTDEEDDRRNKRQDNICWRVSHVCRNLVASKWFMYVIMGAIFLNTLSMGIEYHEQPDEMTAALEILNYIFTVVFAIEMILKLVGLGPYGYIKDLLNIFDALIVIMSIVELFDEGDSGISVLRSFRLLRIFKLVRFMPALQRQLLVMLHTMDNVATFLALLALFIFTASILGMHLFGGKYKFPDEHGVGQIARGNFDDLFWAVVTVFQVLTQEDWNTVMYDGMRATSSWAALYFILMMTIGNYILFNLLVAILVEGFASQPEKSESSPNLQKEKAIYNDRQLVSCPDSYQRMRNSRVCITPTPSVIYIDQLDQRAQCNCHRRSSLPDFHAKRSIVTAVNHRSAPSTPCSMTPTMPRKKHSVSDEPVLVLTHPRTNTETAWYDKDESDTEMESGKDEDAPVKEDNSLFARRREWSLYLFSPNNLFRQLTQKIVANKWFDRIVLLFIILNCVVMAMDGPDIKAGNPKRNAIDICMYIFLGVFTIEMGLKVIAMSLYVGNAAYLSNSWNIMDCFLVVISWIDVIVDLSTDTDSSILGILRVFRALRTLRPLRVISRAPGLKIVVETLISSLKPIGNIVVIAATFFTIFGILGVQLFKGKFYYCDDPSVETREECKEKGGEWFNKEYNFDNLAKALLTLFVFSTKDGWVSIMYDGLDVVGVDKQPKTNNAKWNVIYFVAFLLLAGFVVLNMLVGVVVENFQKCRDLASKDLLREREEKRAKRLKEKRENEAAKEFPQPRRFVYRVCMHAYFDLAIAVIIALNVVCMAMEHYDQPKPLGDFLRIANYFFTGVFILEAVIKIYSMRKAYFQDRWNVLDVIIVILSIVGIALEEMNEDLPINPTIIRVMRVLRIARVLKLLKTAEGIRKLLDTVAQALPAVGNLGLLFLLMFFIFAALGVELFGKIDCDKVTCEGLDEHAHFRSFGFAMLTLFRVSTGDNWNGILKDTINMKRCAVAPYRGCTALQHIAPIYFAIFVLATQFVLLNVVVAVLMKHLEEAREIDLESLQEQESRAVAADASTIGDSNKDIRPSKSSLKVPAEKQIKVSFCDERSSSSEEGRMPESEANNNAEPATKSGSESSLSSREIDKLVRRLPPIDRSDNISLRSTGSANSSYHMLRDRPRTKVECVSVPELSSPKRQETAGRTRKISPRAPIYHLSEDSDWYDSVVNVGNYPQKTRLNSIEGTTETDAGTEAIYSTESDGQANIGTSADIQSPTRADSSEPATWESQLRSDDDRDDTRDIEIGRNGSDVKTAVINPQSAKGRNAQSLPMEHKDQSYV